MQKPTDLDDRIANMTEIISEVALASAAEAKGSGLTAEEVEGVLDWVNWWYSPLSDLSTCSNVLCTEAKCLIIS
jgi:hypothetical protein